MAQKFSFLRVILCWPEGHGSSLGEGDNGRLASQGCEIKGEMNFTSSTRSWLGLCFAIGILGQGVGVAEVVAPYFSSRPL
jgi:hypothetical protein